MVIPPLRRKVLRDLRRLWAQVLAIALVLASGVATLILGNGAYSSLLQTRERFYTENRFADVFADVTRAPLALLPEIEAIDGVLLAEARIVKPGLLDLPDMAEPGAVLFVSLPSDPLRALNRLHLRQGRLPDPQSAREVVISEGFARAHGIEPGGSLPVLMNGQRRALEVTGVALSPEFIYALGPGEIMPDPMRFAVAWLPRTSLEAAYDLEGAFSNLVVQLAPGASADRVVEALDRVTERFGGAGATRRDEQMSHAFLEAELKQLSAMVKVLPPIFLAVAAMLVNMTLSRLVTLEREQIGLLKAVGYSSGAVARHYLEFVLLVAVVGVVIGFGAGAWLGAGLARLYARFFAFPYLVFTRDPAVYGIAALVSLASAVVGALLTVRLVAILPPAVAMAPPAPAVYRRRFGGVGRVLALRQTGVMVVRHLFRWPIRTLGSVLGVSMAGAILVASLWTQGSLDWMIDVTFFRAERQDAILVFGAAAPPRAAFAVAAMPGVLAAEPFRAVPARISHRNLSRRVSIIGKPDRSEISRLLDPDLAPMPLPEDGLILSEALAEALGVRPGDLVTVETLVGPRVVATLPVSGLSVGYLGLGATMRLEGLNRLVGEGDRISGMNILLDQARREEFYAAAKAAPETATVTMSELTLNRFRDTIAENIAMMRSVYVALAAIIAGGVIYNFARISLSEQGRELASLRVLGFSRGEVASILFGELALIVILAQPLGWMAGYGMAWAMVNAFSSDLYRVPLVIGREVFATASLAVLVASGLTGWLIRGRIDRLNMIEVLKTRE